jgi:hypothetical protein
LKFEVKKIIQLCLFSLLLFAAATLQAAEVRKAPEWDVIEWINGQGTTLAELRGKVVIIEFFNFGVRATNISLSR